MNVVIAIDSLKGSLSSLDAGKAIEKGIRKVYPDAQTIIRPLADGGEGTVEALSLGMGGHLETISVTGPAGRAVDATYGIIEETKTAIIEMSAAAGITLVTEEERNPLHTTTYGVGEMIKDAIHKGCRNFIVGIGGSATNDCGIGMLQALGFEFLDENGKQVAFGAKGIKDVVSVSDKNALAELKDCEFKIACDVTNPLCGPKGCSAIYGPQKGATPEMVEEMDQWLVSYADLVAKSFPKADRFKEGTGAAGGLGFAFLTFINASLQSGIDLVLKETSLEAFVNTHQHFASYSTFHAGLNVMDANSNIEMKAMIEDFVKQSKEKTLIAFGASPYSVEEGVLISRQELDEVCPDKEIMVVKYDGHACIVNSKLLKKLKKRVKKHRGYHPESGEMNQEAFFEFSNYITNSISIPKLIQNMQVAVDDMARKGIGCIHTVSGVGFVANLDITMEQVFAKGLKNGFQIRVFPQSLDIKTATRRKIPRIGGCFECALDGCFGSHDAALIKPYADDPTDQGILYYEDEKIVPSRWRDG